MTNQVIKVGMAEYKIAFQPASLITIGLGSCIGVCIWDSVKKIGGMAHIMLPDSTQGRATQNLAKYVDSCLPVMIQDMERMGANKSRLIAKIAGGAQMFSFNNSIMRIGDRNVEATKKYLNAERIKIVAEDTGGNFGRTISFYTLDAALNVRTINKGEKII